MKILVTAPNLITGGAEKQLIYLIEGLVKNGFEIVLFLLELEGEYMARVPREVRVISPISRRPGKPLKGLWKIREIMRAILAEKPDILYSRLWPTKIPTAFVSWLLRKKVVFSEDNTLSYSMAYKDRGRTSFYLRNMTCRLADVIIAVSQGVADDLKQLYKVNSKVRVIYNGFDLEDIEQNSKEEVLHPWFNGADPIAVAVGRLVNQKGFSYLLEAVKLVNITIPLRLLIIGDGNLSKKLKKQSEELGIRDKVDFLGLKTNPFAYMVRCDLFVLSSLYEGLPSTLIEAMALGLPVISTRCPYGPEEIITNEKNGVLVPMANSRAIAEAIIRVLEDKELSKKLRIEGKKRAQDFSLKNMVSEFSEIFFGLSN